jgi:hypothetical protein
VVDSSSGGPNWYDSKISQALDVGTATVERIRKRFFQEGFVAALNNRQYKHKLDGGYEAHLIALACNKAPQGHQRWNLQLLADRMVQLG